MKILDKGKKRALTSTNGQQNGHSCAFSTNIVDAKPLRGFTILELLVVVAIIGIIAAIVIASLDQSRIKGRDAARKSQIQEVLKALELYYSDSSVYPTQTSGTHGFLDNIDSSFYGPNTYLSKLPADSDTRYYYCVSPDRKSMAIFLDTEDDKGGSWACKITRGTGPDYGCGPFLLDSFESCSSRF